MRGPKEPDPPIPSHPHCVHHCANQPPIARLAPSLLARAHPTPRVRALGAEDDDGQLNGDAERERDLKGRLPDQHDAHPDQHGARRVAVRGGGAADAHGRHDRGAHSRCVAFALLRSLPDLLANDGRLVCVGVGVGVGEKARRRR